MGGDPVTLKNFRMAAWAVATWHCMGRYEELAKVMFGNMKVLEGGSLELFVSSGKTYARDDPRTGVVGPTGWEDCPMDYLLSYIDLIRDLYPEEGDKFLFPTLSGKGLPLPKTMSYQSALKQLRKVVKDLNIPLEDGKRFGLQLRPPMQGFPCRPYKRRAAGLPRVPLGAIFSPVRRPGA